MTSRLKLWLGPVSAIRRRSVDRYRCDLFFYGFGPDPSRESWSGCATRADHETAVS